LDGTSLSVGCLAARGTSGKDRGIRFFTVCGRFAALTAHMAHPVGGQPRLAATVGLYPAMNKGGLRPDRGDVTGC